MFYTNVRLFGSSVYYIGYEQGTRVQYKEKITPKLYIKSNTPTDYKSLDGQYLVEKTFSTVKDAKQFIKDYEYVSEFKVYGYEKFHYVWLSDKHSELEFDSKLIRTFYLDIETTTENGFPDINNPQESILCITLYDSYTERYNVFSLFDVMVDDADLYYYESEEELLTAFLNYWVKNYPDVITDWNGVKFDIPYLIGRMELVIGEDVKYLSPWQMIHTSKKYEYGDEYVVYDIVGISHLDYMMLYKKFTYTNRESYSLSNIAYEELGANKLDHSEYNTFKDFYNGNISLDYKFEQPNYIQELCKKRSSMDIGTEEYEQIDSIIKKHGRTKFISYNIVDVRLLVQLEEKMKLLELAIVVSYDAKINFNDVYSQVCCWDNIIYNFLHKQQVIVPSKIYAAKDEAFTGAFVKEPIPGIYDWVVSFDLASLYPHIIQAWNISPETKKKQLTNINIDGILAEDYDFSELGDYCISPSGTLYDRHDDGLLSKLMSKYYEERKQYKKKQLQAEQEYANTKDERLISKISTYKNFQMAKKIAMNSAYGVLGCPYFRYYDIANANSITHSGQVSIRWVSDRINKFISEFLGEHKDRIITNDTDSLFLNLGDLVNKNCKGMSEIEIVDYLDNFCGGVVTDRIKQIYTDLGDYLHFRKYCLNMVRDVISSRFLIKGKKRYIANVWDSEGVRYPKPKMKIVGLEVARSSTPKVYRELLKESYEIIMNEDNSALVSFIKKTKSELDSFSLSAVSITRGVSDIGKYTDHNGNYIKATPIGARSAILYNKLLKELNLTHKYPMIRNGDKFKTLYLVLPNPLHEDTIAFFDTLPVEFGLDGYVNKTIQYEKCFMKPLQDLVNIINWRTEDINTLESFLF